MRKKLFLLLLTIVCYVCLAFGISACSGSNDNTSTSSSSNTSSSSSSEDISSGGESSGEEKHEHSLQAVESVAATCTTDGNIAYWYCDECGKYYSDAEATEEISLDDTVISAGHTYDDSGVCTVCGYETTYDLEFSIDGSYYYTVLGIGESTATEIVIPETYQGVKVTDIAEEAFKNNTTITSVYIPDSVTYIGYSAFYGCTSLKSVTIGSGVETIGSYVFEECTSLTSVTIGNSVTSIGYSVFYNCTSLESVYYNGTASQWASISFGDSIANPLCYAGNLYLKDESSETGYSLVMDITLEGITDIGDSAFYNCTSLTSITIPDSVTSIGYWAFYNCTSLTSITIPDSVTTIYAYAFYDCTSLESVTIGSGVTCIDTCAFYECTSLESVTIPDSVTSINGGAFEYCTSLTSVTIGSGVETIGGGAFEYCILLTSIVIPDSVTSIGYLAFYKCTSLESVTIGSGVETIGDDAFEYCSSLTNVLIGSGVASIGSWAFRYCSSLENVYYSGTASQWASISFGVLWANYSSNPLYYADCLYLNGTLATDITIEDITIINAYTFSNCTSLESVTIGNSVTSISEFTFYNCTSLTSVTIGNGVTSIGSSAFSGCTSLESITIPNSVVSIGNNAFSSCTALTEINFNSTAMEDFSENNIVFANAGQSGNGITVTIGAGVTSIPAYLFCPFSSSSSAPNITSVIFEVNSSCSSIGDYAFAYCTSLESFINFPASATFDTNIVNGCMSLDMLSIYSTIYDLYNNGYYSGTQLVYAVKTADYLIIKDGTTSIAANALADCTNLRFVYIPESVTEIGDGALDFTTSYDSWTTIIYFESSKGADSISTSYTNWLGKYTTDTTATYQGISFTSSAYGFQFLCVASSKIDGDYIYRSEDGLSHASTSSDATAVTYAYFGTDTDVTVPSTLGGYTVSTVGGYTFAETDVTSVTLPSSVTYIGAILYLGSWGGNLGTNTSYNYGLNWMPFTACNKLTTVNINASVAYILGYSFYESTALTTINFASDCQGAAIYNNAFDGCTSLTSITLPELAVIYSGALTGSSLTSVTAGSGDTATICSLTVDTSAYTYSYSVLATVNQGTELATALTGTYLKQDTYINYNSLNS